MNYISVQFFKIYFYPGYPTPNSLLYPFPLPLSRQSQEKLNTNLKFSLNNTQGETNYELLNIKHEVLFF